MPKCIRKITKGKNTGKTCDNYTAKQLNGEYLCAGHYNLEVNKVKKFSKVNKEKEPVETQNDLIMDLENGYTIDEIIEHEYQKFKASHTDNLDINNAKFNHLFDKIDTLNKKIDILEITRIDKNNKSNNNENYDLNNFEVFK